MTHGRISIEILENGYEVELPDVDAMDKAEAAAKKSKGGGSMPYTGDMYKKYAAKTVKDVLTLVGPALKKLPQLQYEEAFADASAEDY